MHLPMLIAKGLAAFSTGILAVETVDPVTTGKLLGGLSAPEILGIVAVISVLAVVLLYRDSRKDNSRLVKLIQEDTATKQKLSDAVSTNTAVMVEVKDAILKCAGPAKR